MAHTIYRTKDGVRVPSVTTVLGRFKESGGLIHWAWECGKDGKDYREERDKAASAGTLAHEMVEAFVRGTDRPHHAVDPGIERKAEQAFGAFKEWAGATRLQVTHPELRLVSERFAFGGTLDAILVSDKVAIGDWKTSNNVYGDYLCQVAAYGLLWEENFPDQPITGGYHIIRFDKEYGDFHHHAYPELDDARQMFLHLRDAYALDKRVSKRAA